MGYNIRLVYVQSRLNHFLTSNIISWWNLFKMEPEAIELNDFSYL